MAEVIEIIDDNNCKKTNHIVKFEFKYQNIEKLTSKSIVCKNINLLINVHFFT